jgi:hypothetical protein
MIFREDAVRHYLQGRDAAVLPRFVSPPTFRCLWAMLGLLVASGVVAWLTPVPVFTSGPAIVVAGRSLQVVAFLPAEQLSRLRVGQHLLLTGESADRPIRAPIVAVAPAICSPESARKAFGLTMGAALAIRQPSAVAIARWAGAGADPGVDRSTSARPRGRRTDIDPIRKELPASAHAGALYRADVQVGTRRLISFLPLVARFYGGR